MTHRDKIHVAETFPISTLLSKHNKYEIAFIKLKAAKTIFIVI